MPQDSIRYRNHGSHSFPSENMVSFSDKQVFPYKDVHKQNQSGKEHPSVHMVANRKRPAQNP
jgi:hypothetical protein